MAVEFPIGAVIGLVDRFTAPGRRLVRAVDSSMRPAFGRLAKVAGAAAERIREGSEEIEEFTDKNSKALDALAETGSKAQRVLTAIVAGAGAAAAAVATLTVRHAEQARQIKAWASQVGIGVERYQELMFVAKRYGVTQSEVDAALEDFAAKLGEMRANTGPIVNFLSQVNRGFLKQLKSTKNNTEALDLMLRGLAAIEDPAKRAALANQAFGGSGRRLVRILEDGTEGIDAMVARAHELGAIMSTETVDGAVALSTALDEAKAAVGGVATEIGARLVPAVKPLIAQFVAWARANQGVIATRLQAWIDRLAKAIEGVDFIAIVEGVAALISAFMTAIEWVGGMRTVFAGLALAITAGLIPAFISAAGTLAKLATFLMAHPVIALAGAVAAAAFLIVAHWDTIGPFFRRLWNGIAAATRRFIGTMQAVWQPLIDVVLESFRLIREIVGGFVDFVVGVFTLDLDRAVGGLKRIFGALLDYFVFVWDAITGVFETAWNVIEGIVDSVMGAVDAVIDAGKLVGNVAGGIFGGDDEAGEGAGTAFPPTDPARVFEGTVVNGEVKVSFDNAPSGMRVERVRADGPVSVATNVGRRGMALGAPA